MPHRFDLPAIGSGLSVADAHDEIRAATLSGAAVVTAPPGTGKSTYVPPLVANLLLERGGAATRVLLTQPRRVAVRAAAARIAELDGSPVGDAVGFTVRGQRLVGRDDRIEALTPGVLLRRLLRDPDLPGVGAVILDEVHERSLEGDLLLGMIAEARALRDDLIVIAMSATLEAERFAALLSGADGQESAAAVVDIASALHPLRIDYAPAPGPRLDDRGVSRAFLAHLADVSIDAQRRAGHDALVFVPGVREVDETVRLLRARLNAPGTPHDIDVLPLHGRLPAREQDRAVRGRIGREPARIVVSTSLAESSLTVPGVRLVIDAGLAREVRRDQSRAMTGLVTVSASRASAEQRGGRAARLGPGRVIRAYAESDFARMPASAPPEIAAADLTDAALMLAAWGTPRGDGLRLPTAPPPAAMHEAETVLRTLGLVDADGRVTANGLTVAQMPVGARAARALLAGSTEAGGARAAAEIVAAFTGDFREAGADLTVLLRELRAGRAVGADRWRCESARLCEIATQPAGAPGEGVLAAASRGSLAPGALLALARPEWIARRVAPASRVYRFASGTRAAIPEGSTLIGSEWIAVHDVQRAAGRAADGTGAVIRLAAPLDHATALRLGAGLRSDRRTATIADGRVHVREERLLGAILLAETPVAAGPADTRPAITALVRTSGMRALTWSDGAASLRHRLALLHRELGAPWPAVDDAALLAGLDDWLGPDLDRLSPRTALDRLDLAPALRRLLPWPDAARLDALVPERLEVPSGNTARIEYPAPAFAVTSGHDAGAGDRPVVAVKLQELFGLAQTPRIVDGRVPVLFHLLSPARRPLAVTGDLESFWNGPYQQVRKEMRGRYPKHPWPEDPWTAPATARTKRASG